MIDHEPSLNVMRRNDRISRNDHAHPVPGMKFKKCCCGKVDVGKKSDADQAAALSSILSIPPTKRYPIGTIACYGPNDRKTTKIVAAVFEYENAKPILERWVSTNVSNNPKVRLQMKALFDRHTVKSVIKMDRQSRLSPRRRTGFSHGQRLSVLSFLGWKTGKCSAGLRDIPDGFNCLLVGEFLPLFQTVKSFLD